MIVVVKDTEEPLLGRPAIKELGRPAIKELGRPTIKELHFIQHVDQVEESQEV